MKSFKLLVSRLFTTVPMMSVPRSELHQRVSDVLEPVAPAGGGRRMVLGVIVCLLVVSVISTGRATNDDQDNSTSAQVADPNDAAAAANASNISNTNGFLPEDYAAWPDLESVELVINRQPFQSQTSLGGLGWLEDGNVLMTANRSDIVFWDVATGEPIGKIVGGAVNENEAVVNREGNRIFASSADGPKLFSWPGLEVVQDFAAAENYNVEGGFNGISMGEARVLSDDGKYLAVSYYVSGNHSVLQVFDCETGEVMFHRRGPSMEALCWSPDGSYLAVGESRGIVIFLTPQGELIRPGIRLEPTEVVESLDISPDGSLIAVCTPHSIGVFSINGRQKVWYHANENPVTGDEALRWTTRYNRVLFSDDGSEVIAYQYRRWDESDLVALDPMTGEELRSRTVTTVYSDLATLSPDGTQIAYEGINHTINLCDAATFEPTVVTNDAWNDDDISGDFHFPVALRAAPDGSRALTVCGGRLSMWDLTTGELLWLNKLEGYCHDACWQSRWKLDRHGSREQQFRRAGVVGSAHHRSC